MERMKIGLIAGLVMLMMVSAVSAVPYEMEEQSLYDMRQAEERLDILVNSPEYQQIQSIVNEYFPQDQGQYVSDTIMQFIGEQGIPLEGDEDLFGILIVIAEAIMLLLGHNLVGETLALLISSLVALPYSLVLGFGFLAAYISVFGMTLILVYALCQDLIDQMFDDFFNEFLYAFGMIFAFIFVLIVGILGTILLAIGLPAAYILCCCQAFVISVKYMFDYIFGGPVVSQQKQSVRGLCESSLLQGGLGSTVSLGTMPIQMMRAV